MDTNRPTNTSGGAGQGRTETDPCASSWRGMGWPGFSVFEELEFENESEEIDGFAKGPWSTTRSDSAWECTEARAFVHCAASAQDYPETGSDNCSGEDVVRGYR